MTTRIGDVSMPSGRTGSADGRVFRFLLVLIPVVTIWGVYLYGRTFSSSFAYDDIDYLNQIADALAGRVPFWTMLLRPQGEHFVPALRLLLSVSAVLFGANALPLRLFVFACHILGGVFLAVAARRYVSSPAAAFAAGFIYVAPGGFSSMWIWFPSGGCVPIGLVGVTGAIAAIAWQERLGPVRARVLAALGLLFALSCDSTLLPLVAGPALLDEFERRRRSRSRLPGPFLIALTLLSVTVVVLSSVYYSRLTGNRVDIEFTQAAKRVVYLLLVAPFRFFFPGIHLPRPLGGAMVYFPKVTVAFGVTVLLGLLAVLLSLYRRELREILWVAALVGTGSVGILFLVGIGRWTNSYEELYDADRYFFTLLIPVAFLTAALIQGVRMVATTWSRRRYVTVACVVAGFLLVQARLHRFAVAQRFPPQIYAAHERRFEQLTLLARRLEAAARALPGGAPPLEFPDASFDFDDVHNRRLSARFMLFILDRERSSRLRLGGQRVGERDESLLNPVLASWARDIGEPTPYWAVEAGELVNLRERGLVDFRIAPHNAAVVEGLYAWEGDARWMGARGELRLQMTSSRLKLVLATSWMDLRRRFPDLSGIPVDVELIDDVTGETFEVGSIELRSEGLRTFRLAIPEPVASKLGGREVRVRLTSSQTWKPSDVIPGSGDSRTLSVRIYCVGFEQ